MPSAASVTNQIDHDRTEEAPDPVRAVLLNEEQPDQDRHGHWHHVRLKQGRGDFETLDRAQHGDRRRDHAVAVEQRGSEDAERDQDWPARGEPWASTAANRPSRNQGGQREHSAFTLVVGTHHDRDVLDRNDQQQ